MHYILVCIPYEPCAISSILDHYVKDTPRTICPVMFQGSDHHENLAIFHNPLTPGLKQLQRDCFVGLQGIISNDLKAIRHLYQYNIW